MIFTRASLHLWVDYAQAEVLFKKVEVSVAMQERMAAGYAECRNVAIDRLAYGAAPLAEKSVVSGCGYREVSASSVEDLESREFFFYLKKCMVVANSL
jgi:hypothetical protein